MKRLILTLFFFGTLTLTAQKNCVYETNISDSIGTLKTTEKYLVNEMVFGNTTKYVFLSLMNVSGYPMLNFQTITKTKDFQKVSCFDKNSRIYFQLTNGKIYTLIAAEENNNCGTIIPDESKQYNINLLTSNFLFMKADLEDLKKYPVVLMRVRYGADNSIDYIFNKELKSDTIKGNYAPETYFINYFKCIEE